MNRPRFLSVKNYERFQHYKDRRPPWIKLYNEILDDYEFTCLPDTTKAHLMLIWLLASRTDNKIPWDAAWISNSVRATVQVDIEALLEAGFLIEHDDLTAKGIRENWASRYIPDDVRAAILERDKHRCVACRSTDNLEIDHIIPVSRGGTGDPSNLQTLCRPCNRRKRATLPTYDGCADAEQVATQLRSPETETETEKRQSLSKAAKAPPDERITVVLDHYRQRHPRRRPGNRKDIAAIVRALKVYTADELCAAIDGNAGDAWHSEHAKNELTYVLRDTGKIDQFIALSKGPSLPAGAPRLAGSNGNGHDPAAEWYALVARYGWLGSVSADMAPGIIDRMLSDGAISDAAAFRAQLRAVGLRELKGQSAERFAIAHVRDRLFTDQRGAA